MNGIISDTYIIIIENMFVDENNIKGYDNSKLCDNSTPPNYSLKKSNDVRIAFLVSAVCIPSKKNTSLLKEADSSHYSQHSSSVHTWCSEIDYC